VCLERSAVVVELRQCQPCQPPATLTPGSDDITGHQLIHKGAPLSTTTLNLKHTLISLPAQLDTQYLQELINQYQNLKQTKSTSSHTTIVRMSFLTTRTAFAARTFATRAFSTTYVAHKSVTETVKETVKTVDKAVASKIVDGIEMGGMYYIPNTL
jgi:hypothetical protein